MPSGVFYHTRGTNGDILAVSCCLVGQDADVDVAIECVTEGATTHAQLVALGAEVDLQLLAESDIPPAVLALGYTGHGAEIYAINTTHWDSVSTRAVADFIEAHP